MSTPAAIAVDLIVADLTDRRGLRHEWENINDRTIAEIKTAWIAAVQAAYAAASPSPASPADDVAGMCDQGMDDLIERLEAGCLRIGEGDNGEELYDVDGASSDMFEAAAALSRLQARLAEVTAEREKLEISRSAWEDSARINRLRAEQAEADLAAARAEIERLTGQLATEPGK